MALGRHLTLVQYSVRKIKTRRRWLSSGWWTRVLILDTWWSPWLAKAYKLFYKVFLTMSQALEHWNVIQSSWNATLQSHSNGSYQTIDLLQAWKWWRRWLRTSWAWRWLWFTTKRGFKPLVCHFYRELPSSHRPSTWNQFRKSQARTLHVCLLQKAWRNHRWLYAWKTTMLL